MVYDLGRGVFDIFAHALRTVCCIDKYLTNLFEVGTTVVGSEFGIVGISASCLDSIESIVMTLK